MTQAIHRGQVLRCPELDTVLMVEEFIRHHSGEFTMRQTWDHLSKRPTFKMFCVIFDYLLSSGRIALDREGKVAWTWHPDLVRRYLKPELVIK